jgi:hypothetical protein
MAIFIVFIMVFSIFGFMMNYVFGTGENFTYNDIRFSTTEQGIKAKINGVKYTFIFAPQQVEWISMPEETAQQLQNTKYIAVTYDPESRFATTIAEAQLYLEQQLSNADIYVERGLTNNTEYPEIKQITCASATSEQPVLELRASNSTEIIVEGDCLIANAAEEREIYAISERALYTMLGVMT